MYELTILIRSHHKGKKLRDFLIKENWIKDAKKHKNIFVAFNLGNPTQKDRIVFENQDDNNFINVKCLDDYNEHAFKEAASIDWLYKNINSKYMFICCDDTYVRPERLLKLCREDHEYCGWCLSRFKSSKKHPSGGAGILISKNSAKLYVEHLDIYNNWEIKTNQFRALSSDGIMHVALKKNNVPLEDDERMTGHTPFHYPVIISPENDIASQHIWKKMAPSENAFYEVLKEIQKSFEENQCVS